MPRYSTTPIATDSTPPGIPFIVGNEAAERFSFYGMRAILVVFMTQYLVDGSGTLDTMGEDDAKAWYHLFVSAVYLMPLVGAALADGWLGKFRTIVILSLVYCLGHAVLAVDPTRWGLALGLGLIAVGSGGIKPCVSAHVGDQFHALNRHLLPRIFGWFYFAINLGAFVSTLATPYLLSRYGPHVAFGVPGGLMVVATWVFWAGRYRFAHIPAAGPGFLRLGLSGAGRSAVARLAGIYLFVAMFWALFDQTGSAWVLQAMHMDRNILGYELLPSQIQAANPLLVMILIPVFSYGIYPAVERVFPLTPLRRMGIGLFVAALAFCVPTGVQWVIDGGGTPHIGWQLTAYGMLTAAEVMVSITCLEFSYTQAPAALKSLVMAGFMLSVAMGNLFTSAVNFVIRNADGTSKLAGVEYYLFFTVLMFLVAVIFVFYARRYPVHNTPTAEGTVSGG